MIVIVATNKYPSVLIVFQVVLLFSVGAGIKEFIALFITEENTMNIISKIILYCLLVLFLYFIGKYLATYKK